LELCWSDHGKWYSVCFRANGLILLCSDCGSRAYIQRSVRL
jgi:hypothetical protein